MVNLPLGIIATAGGIQSNTATTITIPVNIGGPQYIGQQSITVTLGGETSNPGMVYIQLFKATTAFDYQPDGSETSPAPKITSVQWNGKIWSVTMRGPWTEAISLDEHFVALSMRKLE